MESWTAIKQDRGTWLFSWDADSSDYFDIWLDGELLDTVQGGEYEAKREGYVDEPPPLEIVPDESGSFAENELYPPFVTLQWREVAGANSYKVEEYSGGAWVFRAHVMDRGRGYYNYRTFTLTDDVQNQFRVSALDVKGNAGTPVTFTFRIARNPAPPSVAFEIDSIGDLVVSEDS